MHRFRAAPPGPAVASDRPIVSSDFSRTRGPLRYWKPIQTGFDVDDAEGDDTSEVRRLGACSPDEVVNAGVRLRHPVSPHLAARLSGQSIDLEALIDAVRPQTVEGRWIVEGAGGALVPVNDTALMIDVMLALGLPVLIVSRTRLGTINHTLLTIEALRSRSLTVAGVLMVGEPGAANREAIETYGRVVVVGELPPIDPLTPEALGNWARAELDRDGRLPL
jgi:dethiobiotin synthetase